jgi:hypothetical protein
VVLVGRETPAQSETETAVSAPILAQAQQIKNQIEGALPDAQSIQIPQDFSEIDFQ